LPLAAKLLRGEDLRVGRTDEFSATCAFLAAGASLTRGSVTMQTGRMEPPEPAREQLFVQRALILGCEGREAALRAQIAIRRGWSTATDGAKFDRAVVEYLVDLGLGQTWPRDLEQMLEGS
jgi:hypothetical protein